jgi:hypothetical protein
MTVLDCSYQDPFGVHDHSDLVDGKAKTGKVRTAVAAKYKNP